MGNAGSVVGVSDITNAGSGAVPKTTKAVIVPAPKGNIITNMLPLSIEEKIAKLREEAEDELVIKDAALQEALNEIARVKFRIKSCIEIQRKNGLGKLNNQSLINEYKAALYKYERAVQLQKMAFIKRERITHEIIMRTEMHRTQNFLRVMRDFQKKDPVDYDELTETTEEFRETSVDAAQNFQWFSDRLMAVNEDITFATQPISTESLNDASLWEQFEQEFSDPVPSSAQSHPVSLQNTTPVTVTSSTFVAPPVPSTTFTQTTTQEEAYAMRT